MIKAMLIGKMFLYFILLPIVSSCKKFDYQKFDSVFYNGTVMETDIRGLVRAYDCQRACLLTKGCRGFNMQWVQYIEAVGYCDLVDMTETNVLSSKSNHSLYGRYHNNLLYQSVCSFKYNLKNPG